METANFINAQVLIAAKPPLVYYLRPVPLVCQEDPPLEFLLACPKHFWNLRMLGLCATTFFEKDLLNSVVL